MKKQLIIIYSFYFIMGIVTNIGHPVTPDYVNFLGIADRWFGFFFSAMSFGLFVGGLYFGVISGQYKNKTLITIGLIGYAIGQTLFGTFSNPYLILIARFIGGFFIAGTSSLILATVGAITHRDNRSKVMSYTIALTTFGSTVGYKIGGYLGLFFTREVFYIQALGNVGLALWIYFMLEDIETESRKTNMLDSLKSLKEIPLVVSVFLIIVALFSAAQFNVLKFIDVFFIDSGYNSNQLGNYMLVTGVVSIVTNFIIVPLIARFKKDLLMLILSTVLAIVAIFITITSNELLIALYSVFLLFYVANQIFQPFEQSFIASHYEEHLSTIMGLRQSFRAIGLISAPLIGGFLYEINFTYVFYSSIIIYLVVAFLIIYVQRHLVD